MSNHTKPNQAKPNQNKTKTIKSHHQVYNDFSVKIFTIHQQAANEIPDTANRHLFHAIFPH
jgi:hypothetical protein